MHHADSLDLVDMSLALEADLGVVLDRADRMQIHEKQKGDCTVSDYLTVLLGFAGKRKT